MVANPIPNVAAGGNGTAGDKECPAGEHVTGGGVGFVGSGGTGATVIRLSFPFNDVEGPQAEGWVDLVTNLSGTTQSYTSYAICSASTDAVIRQSQFSTSFEGGNRTDCEAGERALSGGFVNTNAGTPVLQVSNPLDDSATVAGTDDGDIARSWFVSVRHNDGTGRTFITRTLCSATSTATVQAAAFVVNNGQSGQQAVQCPAGQRALGGGLGTTGGRIGSMGFSAPVDENGAANLVTGSVARGWFADVYNLTGSQQTYRVYVTCEGPSGAGPGGPGDPAGKSCKGKPATIAGTDDAETLTGSGGDDVIVALGGADTVRARGGNDVVCGGAGRDALKGQGGRDRLLGEAGKDKLGGGGGKGDVCNGGPGRDQAGGSCEKAKKV